MTLARIGDPGNLLRREAGAVVRVGILLAAIVLDPMPLAQALGLRVRVGQRGPGGPLSAVIAVEMTGLAAIEAPGKALEAIRIGATSLGQSEAGVAPPAMSDRARIAHAPLALVPRDRRANVVVSTSLVPIVPGLRDPGRIGHERIDPGLIGPGLTGLVPRGPAGIGLGQIVHRVSSAVIGARMTRMLRAMTIP